MDFEEERKEIIKHAFFEYEKGNEFFAYGTPSYYARKSLPEKSI